jgi:hypothetical protein
LGSGGGGPSPQHWPLAANDLLSEGREMKKLNPHQIFTAVIGSMAVAAFMTSIMMLVRLTFP